MSSTVYLLNGERYLTSGQVADLLQVDQRTVLRWVERASAGRCPELLKRLVWTRDPTNGFTFFQEDSIREIQNSLMKNRPRRTRMR